MHYGERNRILLTTFDVPWRYTPWQYLQLTKQGVQRGLREKNLRPALTGLARGFAESFRYLARRSAVSPRTFRQWRTLGLTEHMTLEQLERIR